MKPPDQITSVAVIGNGLMGQGITQVFARAGKQVRLIGRSPDSLARAMTAIRRNFDAFVERGLTSPADASDAFARITTSPDFKDAAGADHVIEAVPAVRETQLDVFGKLDSICAPDVVIG